MEQKKTMDFIKFLTQVSSILATVSWKLSKKGETQDVAISVMEISTEIDAYRHRLEDDLEQYHSGR